MTKVFKSCYSKNPEKSLAFFMAGSAKRKPAKEIYLNPFLGKDFISINKLLTPQKPFGFLQWKWKKRMVLSYGVNYNQVLAKKIRKIIEQ